MRSSTRGSAAVTFGSTLDPRRRHRAATGAGAALALLVGLAPAAVRASDATPTLTSLAPYVSVVSGLRQPRGVAVAPSGNVYVGDEHDGIIHEVTPDGARRVVASGLERPQGLAVEGSGHLLVLAEKLPPQADGTKGALLRVDIASGATSVLASGLKEPRGIFLAGDGRVYVTAKALVVPGPDEKGVVLRATPGQPFEIVASGFKEPDGVVAREDGTLVVAAERFGKGATRLEGSVFAVAAGGNVSVLVPDNWKSPAGVARDATGAYFVGARRAGGSPGAIVKRRVDGGLNDLASGLREPSGMAFAPNGDLIVADTKDGSVWRFQAPRVPSVNVPDPAYTNQNPFELTGTAGAGALVSVTGGSAAVSTSAGADGAWSASVPLASNAGNTLLVATVGAGGQGLASGAITVHLQHDGVGPTITALADRAPNAAGWYNADVTVTFTCSDSGSGIASCPPAQVVSSEGQSQAVSGTAVDQAGNSSTATLTVSLDKTVPAISVGVAPAPNAAGWNNSDVTVGFSCNDALSGVAACPAGEVVTTEGAGQVVSGTAIDVAGNVALATLTVSLDKTPPTVSAVSAPQPNAEGWLATDASVSFFCLDLLSDVATCPDSLVISSEGAAQTAVGTATDLAGNVGTTAITLNIDKTPPVVTATATPAANARGWNNSDVTVSFQAVDALSGVLDVSAPVTLGEEGAGLTVQGTATDRAGNQAAPVEASVNIDKTPPAIAITSPEPGAVRRVPNVVVDGSAGDANEIVAVRVAGLDAGSASPWSLEVPLQDEGPHTLVAEAEDVAGNTASASVEVVLGIPPVVTITSPTDLAAVGTTPITVTGTVDDPEATITVGLEAVPAVVTGNTFTATGVPLREGGNVVTAAASDALGNASSASVTVVLDTTAPRVLIDSPRGGSVTTDESVTVTGRINDLVLGTVNSGQAQVSVNGIPAEVANRTFIARGVALAPGSNAVTATATDAVGNSDSQTVTVLREAVAGPRLRVLSGDAQTAGIGEILPDALTAALTDGQGQPLVDRDVVFRVAANNGELIGTDNTTGRGLVVASDANGLASVRLRLGTRAGVGNNRVEVTSPGLIGAAVFTASGTAQPADKASVDSGSGQIGAVGQPLPRPFVAVATDAGSNRLGGVPVSFRVLEGEGSLAGETETTVVTDSDGRALVVLTLGPRPGRSNNVVSASVPGHEEEAAGFVASAFEPGDPLETSISGVVLDNSNLPIPGVTLRVRGTALSASADAQGQFRIQPVPVGNVHLQADGTTAQRPGTWPSLEFEIVTVPGIDNTLGMPIHLVQLDTANSIFVDETHGGTLTLPDYPGFSLTVAPNSATFPDGTRRGTVSVTSVHVDKVPMVPNFGQQPRFIVTIQPPGVHFDPPAAVTHPNVDGLRPGEVTEIYSFDHDMGSFVATGTATVSEDGTVIRSDPGMGIVKGGWHCGGNPSGSGTTHNCPTCKKCVTPNCVADDSQTPPQKAPDDCKKEVCRGGSVASDPNDGETPKQKAPDDCKKEVCRGGAPRSDNDDSETPKRVEGNCKKEVCRGGTTASDPDDSDTPPNASQGCCNGDIFTRPQEDCCGSGQQASKYNKSTQCCDNNVVKPAHPIANVLDPRDCPNRVQRVAPAANGCGGADWTAIVPDNPTAVTNPGCAIIGQAPSFTPACNQHDLGYDCCGRSKAGTDTRFGNDMRAACNGLTNETCRNACLAHATRYQDAVSNRDDYYRNAQNNVCRCCAGPTPAPQCAP
jgi:hypothetical protein